MTASKPNTNLISRRWDDENECWDVFNEYNEYDSCHDTIQEAEDRMQEIKADLLRAELADIIENVKDPVYLEQLIKTARIWSA